MSFSNREVELFQLWAKRAEIERNNSSLKARLIDIQKEVKRVARLVNIEASEKKRLEK